MTEHDKILIEEAQKVNYFEWYKINEDAADTQEAKEELHRIASRKYHIDEYYAGLL